MSDDFPGLINWDKVEKLCQLTGHDWESSIPGAERFCRSCYLCQNKEEIEVQTFGEELPQKVDMGWRIDYGDTDFLRRQYELDNMQKLM